MQLITHLKFQKTVELKWICWVLGARPWFLIRYLGSWSTKSASEAHFRTWLRLGDVFSVQGITAATKNRHCHIDTAGVVDPGLDPVDEQLIFLLDLIRNYGFGSLLFI